MKGIPVKAPVTGWVAELHRPLTPGEEVRKGEPLLTLEFMKTLALVEAPAAGTILEVRTEPGQKVKEGDILLVLREGS